MYVSVGVWGIVCVCVFSIGLSLSEYESEYTAYLVNRPGQG